MIKIFENTCIRAIELMPEQEQCACCVLIEACAEGFVDCELDEYHTYQLAPMADDTIACFINNDEIAVIPRSSITNISMGESDEV